MFGRDVKIRNRFLKSIRIDTDINDPIALEGYFCSQTSAEVLEIMSRHLTDTGQGAFTWTGPYGCGKSSLVIALSAILQTEASLNDKVETIFGKRLVNTIRNAFPSGSKGWRILPVVGTRDNPVKVIGEAARETGIISRRPRGGWAEKKLTNLLLKAANFKPEEYGGLVLFIDEMGKFLEAAAHENTDIFFFQEIAELASRSNGRLIVIGVLHQAFNEYAHRLSQGNRDEWSKIQGRYTDILVNTTGEEQIELISHAIKHNRILDRPNVLAIKVAKALQKGKESSFSRLAETLKNCWPLHPVVACLLGPISRRRFGQNQRSIFGFLNSSEIYGFQFFLQNKSEEELYGPDLLWDYLRANLEPSILSSPDGHKWALATEAIERCESIGGDILQIKLLKTISVIDLFKERSGLIANFELLKTCFQNISDKDLERALSKLDDGSFTIFKKFLDARSIFAGSDFDIEVAIRSALEDIDQLDFKELNSLAGFQPILAKRHYHKTGSLRWFDVEIVPYNGLTEYISLLQKKPVSVGYFLLVIPTDGESELEVKKICQHVVDNNKNIDIVVGFSKSSWKIIPLSRELLAVDRISNDHSKLIGDSVARREVSARHATLQSLLENELKKSFECAEWHRKNKTPKRFLNSELNNIASDLVDERFSESPIIHNELLNRENPSGSAIGAQNNLLRRMILKNGEPRLGIQNFPSEGGLFATILESTGLYSNLNGSWHFVNPNNDKSDVHNLYSMWSDTSNFLKENASRNVAVSELFQIWHAPPYGVKTGLLPILVVAFILSNLNKLAIYRNELFRARFDDVDVEYLAKDPSFIQVRWMDLNDYSRSLLSGLAQVVCDLDNNILTLEEPIEIGRGLVSLYTNLPNWTQRTMQLSSNAQKVRELFKRAQDPNQFLFDDIPNLFESSAQDDVQLHLYQVITSIREGLEELITAYPQMLSRLREIMLMELQITNSSSNKLHDINQRSKNIKDITGDFRLNAFIGRLTTFDGSDKSFEEIASLVANKPPRDWTDQILDKVAIELAEMSQKFIHAEIFAHVKGRSDKRQAMAIFIGNNNNTTSHIKEFSVLDTDRKPIDDLIRQFNDIIDNKETNQRIILAALAELSTNYMSSLNPYHSIETVET
ncbi:MAG: hypothetical protein OXD45_04855 [Rhodobacteraceae bacterium]|nr:hypothetical protein [Paracoccaceae bacterium]